MVQYAYHLPKPPLSLEFVRNFLPQRFPSPLTALVQHQLAALPHQTHVYLRVFLFHSIQNILKHDFQLRDTLFSTAIIATSSLVLLTSFC